MKTIPCPQCHEAAPIEAALCPSCKSSLIGPSTRLQTGSLLADRYRIVRPLARGGMSAVYVAEDLRMGDLIVAVKEMRVGHAGNTEALQKAVAEFHREAAVLAQLTHPHLPRVFDQFAHDGVEYLVMEFVPGETLQQRLNASLLPCGEEQVRAWGCQLCEVLQYLHTRTPPLIYRDLKPANVMLRPDGQLVLLDFGIARYFSPEQGDTAVFGTVGYAPPEQYAGRTEARSDIWSLGVLLHQLATGYNPLDRPYRPLPPARTLRPDLSVQFESIIEQATAEEPEQRFADATAFAAALRGEISVATHPRRKLAVTGAATSRGGTARSRAGYVRRAAWTSLSAFVIVVLALLSATGAFSADWLPTPGRFNTASPAPAAGSGVTAEAGQTRAPPNGEGEETTSPQGPRSSTNGFPVPPDMVIVPAGSWYIGEMIADDQPEQAVGTQLTTADFLIERTEVTNGQYAACVAAGACHRPRKPESATRPNYFDNPSYANYPVVFVSWHDARRYCAWRGRRLPTEAEWEKAARGDTKSNYPWGNDWEWDPEHDVTFVTNVANSWDTGGQAGVPRDTARVGERLRRNGASPYGALDMVGNVGEWTSSRHMPGRYNPADGRELVATSPGTRRVVRGMPVGNEPTRARVTTREALVAEEATAAVGFRCAAGPGVLGRSGLASLALPSAEPPVGMRLLKGDITYLGTSEAEADEWTHTLGWPFAHAEIPQTPHTLNDFYLDQFEVTNAAYRAFVLAQGHPTPRNSFNPEGLAIWKGTEFAPELAEHPVVNVNWHDASAYCRWLGKRLPTEAEWEWAAGGPSKRLWPWGDSVRGDELNSRETALGTTAPVNAFEQGRTPDGIANLGGNVWEWTSSLSLPYPYDVFDGREDPEAEGARVIRGGSWMDIQRSAHTTGRAELQPEVANVNVGFRCAQDAQHIIN